jgi:hypothetical protein
VTRRGQRPGTGRTSDATFWRAGTYFETSYWSVSGRPRKAMAGWKRAAIWLLLAAAGAGWVMNRAAAETGLLLGATAGAVIGGVAARRRWQDWSHHRARVRPLALALASVVDMPAADPRAWVHVPRGYRDDASAVITVGVPDHFTGAGRDMEDITRAVTAKLGIEAPQVTSCLKGNKPRLEFTRGQPPPSLVTLGDVRGDIAAAKPSEVVLGLGVPAGGKRQVVILDVDSETPQTAASMTTGDGKSTLGMSFGAQFAHHGAYLIILDYKWFSHMWADGLPNATYARTPQEIHEVLCWLGHDDRDSDGAIVRESELTRRKRVGLAAARAGVPADVGPRLIVIAEELNATGKVLKRHWRAIGGKGPCPSLEALDEVGATGRQLCANALYIAQRLSARVSGSDGSADARENIGGIILKDPTKATWDMLGGGHAQPPASGHKGRYQLVTRKEVREFQGTLMTEAEARDLATSGIVAVPRHDMPFAAPAALVPAGVGQPAPGGTDAGDLRLVPSVPAALPAGGTVKLADMVAAGLFVTIHAARKASTRDPLFPRPVPGLGSKHTGWLYAVTDVREYLAAKGRI